MTGEVEKAHDRVHEMNKWLRDYENAHHCGEQGFGQSANDQCAACARPTPASPEEPTIP